MCGICGIYNYKHQDPVTPGVLAGMLQSIYHRGPDHEGRYEDDAFAFGMRRLSIIALSTGNQPMFNEDKRYALVFNGEIYNYRQLRKQLQARGHIFTTESDTEVIVHLYEEYGKDCADHLRGMFAFAVWDKVERTVYIARDHLGIKPLYYTQQGDRLLFASEIKALLADPDFEPLLDHYALNQYLTLRYVPAPGTLLQDVYLLPPGHWMLCSEDGVVTHQYWDVEFNEKADPTKTEDDYASELKDLLHESVNMRLMSDVPFGAFLSGGVDSSTVVAIMSQLLDQPVKTFSVGFGDDGIDYSELPYARVVAEKFETDHHELLINAGHFMDHLEDMVWHMDQPIADYAQVAYFLVARLASEHVKMVLTGEGGDELFAGYGRYVGERYAPLFQRIPQFGKQMARTALETLPQLRRVKSALYALSMEDEASRFAHWIPQFTRDNKKHLLTKDVKRQLKLDQSLVKYIIQHTLEGTEAKSSVNRLSYMDLKLWLPDYLLIRGDKLTMASSLEGRVPLLDKELVAFAGRLPAKYKMMGTQRKYLLKKVAGDNWLPDEIINRKKKGFPVPVPKWLRQDAREYTRDMLSPERVKQRGLFDYDFVSKLLDEHQRNFADHATMIYGLLTLEIWQQQFIDGARRPVADVTPVIEVDHVAN